MWLTYQGQVEWRIYESWNQTIIGSDYGLSPLRCQAIIWTNVDYLKTDCSKNLD